MALLFDEDYDYLKSCNLIYKEDEAKRLLIIKNYPLPQNLYQHNGSILQETEILVVIPENYNTNGIDMLWTHPRLLRSDGKAIPATSDVGGADPRFDDNKEYCRWSRHWPPDAWKPKIDNIIKILSRIEWALQNPNAGQP